MSQPRYPIQTYEFRNLHGRGARAVGREDPKDRFWLVLSGAPTHKHKLFTASSVTSASERSHREYLFPPDNEPLGVDGVKPDSRIDVQQIWTFPSDRDATDRTPVPALDSETFVAQLKARIRRQLTAQPGRESNPYDVGRVVWVKLAGDPVDPMSDLHAVQRRLNATYDSPWKPGSPLLPAVVIATSVHERADDLSVFPLITAVPMLVLPRFREKFGNRNPSVECQGTGGAAVYTVLTQLLLTVDYEAGDRVQLSNGAQKSWCVADRELEAIRTDVLGFMGIRHGPA